VDDRAVVVVCAVGAPEPEPFLEKQAPPVDVGHPEVEVAEALGNDRPRDRRHLDGLHALEDLDREPLRRMDEHRLADARLIELPRMFRARVERLRDARSERTRCDLEPDMEQPGATGTRPGQHELVMAHVG